MVPPTNGYATFEVAPDSEGNHAFESTVSFSCSIGLGIVGPQSSKCDEDGDHHHGTFTPNPPVCDRELLSVSLHLLFYSVSSQQ